MKKNKTQPKQTVHHMQSSHPEKGRCSRRGVIVTHWDEVSCALCLTHKPVAGATPSTIAALHRMAGASQ